MSLCLNCATESKIEAQTSAATQRAKIGNDVTLWCNASGYPTPVVYWTREDRNRQLPDGSHQFWVIILTLPCLIVSMIFRDKFGVAVARSAVKCTSYDVTGLTAPATSWCLTGSSRYDQLTYRSLHHLQCTLGNRIEHISLATVPEMTRSWLWQNIKRSVTESVTKLPYSPVTSTW